MLDGAGKNHLVKRGVKPNFFQDGITPFLVTYLSSFSSGFLRRIGVAHLLVKVTFVGV